MPTLVSMSGDRGFCEGRAVVEGLGCDRECERIGGKARRFLLQHGHHGPREGRQVGEEPRAC